MKNIRPVTALAAALFLASSLTACGSLYSEGMKTLDTPAKASLSALAGTPGNAEAVHAGSEEDLSRKEYAGEYIMFGLGNKLTNIQNKKIVVSNEAKGAGSVILKSDGTGIFKDSTKGIDEPVTKWTVSDGSFSMTGASFIFSGTIKDGILIFGNDSVYYFARKGADISSYSIVADKEYKTQCMTGTYYLTRETKPDGSVSLNRTQLSWTVLNGVGTASLKLNAGGTGALETGDHHDIAWDTEKITLDGQEYSLDLKDGIIAVDMKDYTLEFSYIGEGDYYLQLTWEEVSDPVEKEVPGSFCPLGGSGFEYYVPASYIKTDPAGDPAAGGMISGFAEQTDTDFDGRYDNDIHAYLYTDHVSEDQGVPYLESFLDSFKANGPQALDIININGRDFICCESFNAEYNDHTFEFFTVFDNGYEMKIIYRTENSTMNDAYRALVYKLASSIRVIAE